MFQRVSRRQFLSAVGLATPAALLAAGCVEDSPSTRRLHFVLKNGFLLCFLPWKRANVLGVLMGLAAAAIEYRVVFARDDEEERNFRATVPLPQFAEDALGDGTPVKVRTATDKDVTQQAMVTAGAFRPNLAHTESVRFAYRVPHKTTLTVEEEYMWELRANSHFFEVPVRTVRTTRSETTVEYGPTDWNVRIASASRANWWREQRLTPAAGFEVETDRIA